MARKTHPATLTAPHDQPIWLHSRNGRGGFIGRYLVQWRDAFTWRGHEFGSCWIEIGGTMAFPDNADAFTWAPVSP
jgi:hypothetical protein